MAIEKFWKSGNWYHDSDGQSRLELPGADENSIAIPALPNVHSHAFQRALAGLTEFRSENSNDDFWTWRNQMYAFLQHLNPDDCFAIACQLYAELLERGFTWVGEFHYLHNQVDGVLYDSISEMSDVLIAAAKETGIRITLLPVLYQRGGFDHQPLNQHQGRFYLNTDQYCQLVTDLDQKYRQDTNVDIGIAFHSLRAVGRSAMLETLHSLKPLSDSCPIHIHVAEQVPEVEACIAKHALRPVEYCLDNLPVDQRWCFIHATHMTENETIRMAKSGALAGLCPTTEANLGDGVFPATFFLENGGTIALGTDSHIAVCPFGEMRLLEYGQRLSLQKRVLLDQYNSSGMTLFQNALAGGRQSLSGNSTEVFGDWILLDKHHTTLAEKPIDRIFDCLVFCEHGSPIDRVYVDTKCVVKNGRHFRRDEFAAKFKKAMHRLMAIS